jgi:hypothetical protein
MRLGAPTPSLTRRGVVSLISVGLCAPAGLVRSRAALQAEILFLPHQVNVLRRKSPKQLV